MVSLDQDPYVFHIVCINAKSGKKIPSVFLKLNKESSQVPDEGLTRESGQFMF